MVAIAMGCDVLESVLQEVEGGGVLTSLNAPTKN